MHRYAKMLADYCKSNFIVEPISVEHYQSLSVCILDCIYSLRAVYETMTLPVVDRYAEKYMHGNRKAAGDTISDLLNHIEAEGGPKAFADHVLKNHQKIGGKNAVPKEEVCYKLAQYLKLLQIETMEDFRQFESPELLEIVIRSVKGMGDAGTNYLFMLAGDANRCKPDVHLHRCITDACGEGVSIENIWMHI